MSNVWIAKLARSLYSGMKRASGYLQNIFRRWMGKGRSGHVCKLDKEQKLDWQMHWDGWMDPKSIWCHTGVFILRLNVYLVANLSFYHTMWHFSENRKKIELSMTSFSAAVFHGIALSLFFLSLWSPGCSKRRRSEEMCGSLRPSVCVEDPKGVSPSWSKTDRK